MKCIAKAVLINPNRLMLMVLRDNKPTISHPNYWSLLGGKIEDGEDVLAGLQRELKEEISCDVHDLELIGESVQYGCRKIIYRGRFDEELDNIKLYEGQRLNLVDFKHFKKLRIPLSEKRYLLKNMDKILE